MVDAKENVDEFLLSFSQLCDATTSILFLFIPDSSDTSASPYPNSCKRASISVLSVCALGAICAIAGILFSCLNPPGKGTRCRKITTGVLSLLANVIALAVSGYTKKSGGCFLSGILSPAMVDAVIAIAVVDVSL